MKKHVQYFVLVAVTAFGCVYGQAQELPGLVSWWQGENNLLDSKGTNNGSVYVPPPPPTPVPYVPGKYGQAFSFAGGIVEIPHAESLAPQTLTVQAWVRGTNLPAYRYIICKARGAGGVSYAIYTGAGAGALFFVSRTAGGGALFSGAVAPASIWDDTWHQLTATYDGTDARLYLDGTEVPGGGSSPGAIDYSSPQPLIFADYQVARGLAYPGMLDEVKIFDRVLTAEEVMETYSDPAASAGTNGLVSWYKGEGNAQDSWGTNNGSDGNSAPPPARIFTYGDGKNGAAFFPKNGIAIMADAPELRPENVTVQAWVKSVAPGTFRYIACKSRAVGGVSYALYTENSAGINFFVTLENVGTIKSPVLTPDKIWDGAWHLATGTFDGTTVRLFVDGLEVGSGTPLESPPGTIDYSSPNELVVADYQIAGGLPFWGLIDDLQIYNRALDASEILQYFTQSRLVSWWKAAMDANDSIDGNHGTLVGTASYGVGRTVFGAFEIGSAGSVQVPDAASLRPNTITVEAAVSALAPGANKYILSKSNTDTDSSYALFTGPSGGLAFYVTTPSGRVVSPVADDSIWDGTYHAIAGVYDGAKVSLFVDGKEVGVGTAGTGNIAYGSYQSGKLLFGDFSETPGSAVFDGKIDDVKIYNAALTAKDVANDAFLPILIVNQPVGGSITPGSTATLSVTARGEAPIRYQWIQDGADLPGATNATLVLSNAQPGSYAVRISPGTVTYTAGKYGQAYNAGAGGIARVPNDPAFYTNTSFTIQMWAKGTNVSTYQYLISKSRDPSFYSSSYGLYTADTAGVKMFVVLDGATFGFITASAGPEIWDDNWHQITGTWDGNFLGLYIDGNLAELTDSFGGGDITFTTNFLGGDILIGEVVAVPGNFHFPGQIDEVKFFERALSGTEVSETYTNPNGPAGTTGLVSWWKLDNNLLDATGHNDGYPLPPAASLLSQTAVLSVEATPPSIGDASVSGGIFQATVTGGTGSTYIVLRSSDLASWAPFTTNTAPFTFTDPVGPGGQFYRVQGN